MSTVQFKPSDQTELQREEINWFPVVVEAGPSAKFCFDTRTGEILPALSDGDPPQSSSERSGTSDTRSLEGPEHR